jgi:DNA-binding CsgD family transcriptional regulator
VRRLRVSGPDATGERAIPGLSKREADVARRVAGGATNAQIAEDLAIGVGTVEKHITAIFSKLGVRKRSQIAATYAGRERVGP